MIMYCKIQGKVSPILPKTNGLECGCMLPLKNCKVETLVGKGVFKLICQREELILYSNDGSQSSEVFKSTFCCSKFDFCPFRRFSSDFFSFAYFFPTNLPFREILFFIFSGVFFPFFPFFLNFFSIFPVYFFIFSGFF